VDFSNGKISSAGHDTIEIPVVNRKIILGVYQIVIILSILLIFSFSDFIIAMLPQSKLIAVLLIPFLVASVVGLLFCVKQIIFSFSKNKVMLEFDNEKFIFNGEIIKWADILKITCSDSFWIRRGVILRDSYNITISCEYIAYVGCAKEYISKELTKNNSLKIGVGKTVKLIADKFYQYYGTLHGVVMLKDGFLPSFIYPITYELKQVSRKDVFQEDSLKSKDEIKLPNMFR